LSAFALRYTQRDSVYLELLHFVQLSLPDISPQRERAEAREKGKKEEKRGEAAVADRSKGNVAGASDVSAKKEKADAKQRPRDAAAAAPHQPVPEPSVPARELTEQEKQV
jgi:hypothetical protein